MAQGSGQGSPTASEKEPTSQGFKMKIKTVQPMKVFKSQRRLDVTSKTKGKDQKARPPREQSGALYFDNAGSDTIRISQQPSGDQYDLDNRQQHRRDSPPSPGLDLTKYASSEYHPSATRREGQHAAQAFNALTMHHSLSSTLNNTMHPRLSVMNRIKESLEDDDDKDTEYGAGDGQALEVDGGAQAEAKRSSHLLQAHDMSPKRQAEGNAHRGSIQF